MDTNFWESSSTDSSSESECQLAKRPAQEQVVSQHLDALTAAGRDQHAFDRAIEALRTDATAKTPELIEIAKSYAGRGKKIGSQKVALEIIRKRFIELVRYDAKNKVAKHSRPW